MTTVLAWTLVHFLWQGALIGLAAWTLLRVLSPARAELRYSVSCLLLLAMALCPVVTLFALWPAHTAAASGAAGAAPTVVGVTPGIIRYDTPLSWSRWTVTAWLCGVLLLGVRAAAGWTLAWHRQWRDRHPIAVDWQHLAARFGITRAIRWFASAAIDSPQVFGWWKPVVLVPLSAMTALPAAQLEALLAHELAHIRRHDYLVNLLQVCLETVLFYHPAVWWLSARVRGEREACCDRMAARACGDPVLYGRALLVMEETRQRFALAATGASLRERVQRLLLPCGITRGAWPVLVALGLAVMVALSPAYLLRGQDQPKAQEKPKTGIAGGIVGGIVGGVPGGVGQQAPRESPYAKWLNEDVVYIITDNESPDTKWLNEDVVYIITEKERAEFLKLKSDKEREKFIEAFWRRRDPTPDTEENEFKEEHYRRIAYSNDRFASNVPGWKTDRGRMYITLGPPDEVESHPTERYEIWLYRATGDTYYFSGPDYHLDKAKSRIR